jgi:hypothetical protein
MVELNPQRLQFIASFGLIRHTSFQHSLCAPFGAALLRDIEFRNGVRDRSEGERSENKDGKVRQRVGSPGKGWSRFWIEGNLSCQPSEHFDRHQVEDRAETRKPTLIERKGQVCRKH